MKQIAGALNMLLDKRITEIDSPEHTLYMFRQQDILWRVARKFATKAGHKELA